MARPQKHDWINLRLEYNQGKYKNLVEFSEAKGINYDRLRKEFKKVDLNPGKTGHNGRAKPGKKAFTVPAEDDRPQCEAISHKTGERCRKKAVPGERFCHIHLDGWEGQCQSKSRQTGERCRRKAVAGKRVCKFHGGLSIGSPGHQNGLKHGFFAKIFPDDEETRALINDIINKGPLDILWENIVIQYLVIARAQKITWIKNKDDMTKVLTRERNKLSERTSETEREWEIQQAWDKYNRFLTAQSKAMVSLEKLIARYEELLQKGLGSEEHRLRLEKLKIEVEKIQGSDDDNSLNDLAKALEESRRRAGGVSSNGEV